MLVAAGPDPHLESSCRYARTAEERLRKQELIARTEEKMAPPWEFVVGVDWGFAEGTDGTVSVHRKPRVKFNGTVTGRFSSKEPNMHHMHRPPVTLKDPLPLLNIDYRPIETRMLDQMAMHRMKPERGEWQEPLISSVLKSRALKDVLEKTHARPGEQLPAGEGSGAGQEEAG